jgi:hypothetical protein
MPASAYSTPAAKKRQAIFKLIQMHMRFHLRTIRETFSPMNNGTPSNRYLSLNYKALSKALQDVAELYIAGEDITILEVEAAISTYATAHPKSIRIASLSGYQEVFLEGEWPNTITLNALVGDSTVIIIVSENGTQTTINADGTVTTSQYTGGGGSSSNTGTGTNTGGTNTGGTNTGGANTGVGDNGGGSDDGGGQN